MTELTQVGLITQIEQRVVLYRQMALWSLLLGTMQVMGCYGSDYAMLLAFITLNMVPVIISYIFAERQIVSEFTAGAM